MSFILNNQRQQSCEKWFKTGWIYVSTVFKSKFSPNHLNISRNHYTQLVSLLLPSRLHGASVSCSCDCCTLTEATPLRYYPAVAHLCLQLVSSETFHLLLPFCICLNQSDHWPLTPGINKSILSRLVHRLYKDRYDLKELDGHDKNHFQATRSWTQSGHVFTSTLRLNSISYSNSVWHLLKSFLNPVKYGLKPVGYGIIFSLMIHHHHHTILTQEVCCVTGFLF